MAQVLTVQTETQTDVEISGVSTDSRTLRPGDLFVALSGDNFDGHDFVEEAARKGAAAAIVSGAGDDGAAGALDPGFPVLVVDDTLWALQELAAWYRDRFDLTVVGVTGTNGKTTTKDMIASVLSTRLTTAKTIGNYNNHIGVPLTLFEIAGEHEVAVVEIGMNHPGEITHLAGMAKPSIGVVTNVAEAHLETMHDIDTVAQAKAELVDALPSGGTSVLNWDDERVRAMWARGPSNVVSFGLSADAEVRAVEVTEHAAGVSFELADDGTMGLTVPGRHNVSNALAAVAVGRIMEIPDDSIREGLLNFEPSPMRMKTEQVGLLTILNDAYNCNPGSLRAALEALVEIGRGLRKAAALGDMLELGTASERAHRDAGLAAAGLGIDRLFLFGAEVEALRAGAVEGGMPPSEVRIYESKTALVDDLRSELGEPAVLLVKGSRGMRMEEVVESLMREAPAS